MEAIRQQVEERHEAKGDTSVHSEMKRQAKLRALLDAAALVHDARAAVNRACAATEKNDAIGDNLKIEHGQLLLSRKRLTRMRDSLLAKAQNLSPRDLEEAA